MAALPTAAVADVLALLAEYLPVCPHLEFILKWLQALCLKHGPAIQVSLLCLQGHNPLPGAGSMYLACRAVSCATSWHGNIISKIAECNHGTQRQMY